MSLPSNVRSKVQSTLTNPAGQFSVPVHNKSFPTESFSNDEAEIFTSQLNTILANVESSTLNEVITQRAQTVAQVATYAKHELDSKVFGGINAGDNEIGFSVIRPGHIRADPSNGNSVNDWYFTPSSTGYNDWIGDGSNNNYQVNEDQVMAAMAFVDEAPNSEVSGVNVQEFGRNMDMLPQDLNDAQLQDNSTELSVQEIPTLVASDNDSIHARLDYDRVVESEPRLFGFTYGLGAYLNQESF